MIRGFREQDAEPVLALIRELLPLRVETVETVLFDARRGPTWVAEVGGEVVGLARLRGSRLALGAGRRARPLGRPRGGAGGARGGRARRLPGARAGGELGSGRRRRSGRLRAPR